MGVVDMDIERVADMVVDMEVDEEPDKMLFI